MTNNNLFNFCFPLYVSLQIIFSLKCGTLIFMPLNMLSIGLSSCVLLLLSSTSSLATEFSTRSILSFIPSNHSLNILYILTIRASNNNLFASTHWGLPSYSPDMIITKLINKTLSSHVYTQIWIFFIMSALCPHMFTLF